jgi:hypothetical protein
VNFSDVEKYALMNFKKEVDDLIKKFSAFEDSNNRGNYEKFEKRLYAIIRNCIQGNAQEVANAHVDFDEVKKILKNLNKSSISNIDTMKSQPETAAPNLSSTSGRIIQALGKSSALSKVELLEVLHQIQPNIACAEFEKLDLDGCEKQLISILNASTSTTILEVYEKITDSNDQLKFITHLSKFIKDNPELYNLHKNVVAFSELRNLPPGLPMSQDNSLAGGVSSEFVTNAAALPLSKIVEDAPSVTTPIKL